MELFIVLLICIVIFLLIIISYNRYQSYNNIGKYLTSLDSTKAYLDSEITKRNLGHELEYPLLGGKKLRGALLLDVAFRSSKGQIDATQIALSYEYIHTASLIIDDMPYFDNDDMRRGKLSCHKKFGVAKAHMIATKLSSLAIENLSRQSNDAFKLNYLAKLLSGAIYKTANGQDFENSVKNGQASCSKENLEIILTEKTSSLFEAAILSGWILGNSYISNIQIIREIALHFGTAFQIADDIGDLTKDHQSINYVNCVGVDIAKNKINYELTQCKQKLLYMNLWSPIWEDAFNIMLSNN